MERRLEVVIDHERRKTGPGRVLTFAGPPESNGECGQRRPVTLPVDSRVLAAVYCVAPLTVSVMARKRKAEEEEQETQDDPHFWRHFLVGLLVLAAVGAVLLGFVFAFFFGARETLIVYVRLFGLVVTAAVVLYPLAVWVRMDPRRAGAYFGLRRMAILIFAALMLLAIGMREGIPGMNGIVEELICAPGYENLTYRDADQGMSFPAFFSFAGSWPACFGELGFYEPRFFSRAIATVAVYLSLVLLWFGVDYGIIRALGADRAERTRYILTPVLAGAMLTLLYVFPAPLKAVLHPVTNLLADGGHRPTLLHQAIRTGSLESLRDRLEAGDRADGFPALGRRSDAKNPPLYLALRRGLEDHARLLLEHGAEVTPRDRDKATALHHVAASGLVTLIDPVLERGAALEAQDRNGETPLLYALKNGRWEVARALLERGADPTAADEQATQRVLSEAMGAPIELMRTLRERGAPVDGPDIEGRTPLVAAAAEKQWQYIPELAAAGADVNAQGKHGRTALHHAARSAPMNPEHRPAIRAAMTALLEHGADPNVQDSEGNTPLVIIVKQMLRGMRGASSWYVVYPERLEPDLALVRLLVAHGADPHLKAMDPRFAATDWAERAWPRENAQALLRALRNP